MRKVVVLGAGTMGAQVAAHVVAQGLEVALLDVAGAGADRNAAARKGLETLRKLKPSPLHLPEHAAALRPGNFDDDLARELKDADWVFEAVLEDLEVKKQLLARVAPLVKKSAIVTSNTSGLGIAKMTADLPEDFRRRFLGTHFFNPPRYLQAARDHPGARDRSRGRRGGRGLRRAGPGQGRRALQGHAQLHRQPHRVVRLRHARSRP